MTASARNFSRLGRLLGPARLEHLQGDRAADRRLPGGIDDAHAPFAQLFQQVVVDPLGGLVGGGIVGAKDARLNHQRVFQALGRLALQRAAADAGNLARTQRGLGRIARLRRRDAAVPHVGQIADIDRDGANLAFQFECLIGRGRREPGQLLGRGNEFAGLDRGAELVVGLVFGRDWLARGREQAAVGRRAQVLISCRLAGGRRPWLAGGEQQAAVGGRAQILVGRCLAAIRLGRRHGLGGRAKQAAFDGRIELGGQQRVRHRGGTEIDRGRADIADRELPSAGGAFGRRAGGIVERVIAMRASAHEWSLRNQHWRRAARLFAWLELSFSCSQPEFSQAGSPTIRAIGTFWETVP